MSDKIKFINSEYNEKNFNGLKERLSITNNFMENRVISIFDMYSTNEMSLIVPVPIEYVLQITSYGFGYIENSFITLEETRVKSITKEEVEKHVQNIVKDSVLSIPEAALKTMVGTIEKKHNGKIAKMVENIFNSVENISDKGVHILIGPIYALVKIYETIKDGFIPVLQDIIDIVDHTWLGKLFHSLLNTSSVRPTNDLTAMRVRLYNNDDEMNKCETHMCCACSSNSLPSFKNFDGYKIVYPSEPVLNFRHTYANNISVISSVGYYIFKLSCLNVPNTIGVEGIYLDRNTFYQNGNKNIDVF